MTQHSEMAQKTAVRFAKIGPSIYHSHHDMLRFWERAVKRAELPVRLTQGFNPRPRIIFPHALGLGIASRCEEVELELYAHVDLNALLKRLVGACGDTLAILDAEALPPVKKSRQLTAASYAVSGWNAAAVPTLAVAAGEVLAMEEIVVERGAPGDRRRVDVRPYLQSLKYDPESNLLLFELRYSQGGGGRPDEIVKAVAERTGTDWHDLAIEKTGMTLV